MCKREKPHFSKLLQVFEISRIFLKIGASLTILFIPSKIHPSIFSLKRCFLKKCASALAKNHEKPLKNRTFSDFYMKKSRKL
ncbi:MAG: hypothetical protein A2Y12_04140 [Planctomycetes bacterium GWF2_42_9]|nr:MAG: hypothetical protein A2Y12_04140 [Planctomycetes bacterium GWF2_42_9]